MKSKGYTLIEILVTTTIMVLLALFVLQITGQIVNIWGRSSAKLSTTAEARIAMDIIANDLEGLVLRNDGYEWFRAENILLKEPANSKSVALRFFSVIKDKPKDSLGMTMPGDICAVAYDLDYVNPINGSNRGNKSFVLYRMEIDPEKTYNYLLDPISRINLPNGKSSTWGKGNYIKGKNGDNFLAMNIANFEIDFYVEDDGDRLTPTLYFERTPKNTKRSVIYGGKSATIGPQAKLEHYQRPLAYAEIKLTILSDKGAEMLRNIDQRSESPEDVIRLHGEEFIRRVHFPVKPF